MIHKTFRPATSVKGERAGRDNFAWQQLFLDNSKTPPFEQQLSVTSFSVDDYLNVIKVKFGPHPSEVQP